MARDIRINDNQLCLVMGKRAMEEATRGVYDAISRMQKQGVLIHIGLVKVAHELSCATEIWPDER